MTDSTETDRWRNGEPLKVREEEGQRSYSLEGRALKGCEWLELLLYDGSWLRIQFGKPKTPGDEPTGCIAIDTRNKNSLPVGILFTLHEEAVLRWPAKN